MRKIWLLLMITSLAQASPEQGMVATDQLLQELKITPNYAAGAEQIEKMPYEREKEKHARWQQNQHIPAAELEKTGASQAMTEAIGEQLLTAEKTRPRFDEISDLEVIKGSEQYVQHVAQELITDGVRVSVTSDPNTDYTVKVCQHSRAPEKQQCISYLQDPLVEVTPEKSSHFWCSLNNHRPDDQACRAKTYYPIPRVYQEKIVKVSPDVWVSECHALEARSNECRIVKKECLDATPHVINGESIARACWKYQYTYECKYPVQESCEPLLKQGCTPLNSKCVFMVKDKCYIWEQRYQCPINPAMIKTTTEYVRPFCLEGECFNTTVTPNDEMFPAIAQLGIFAEMQRDIRSHVAQIFKGGAQGCNKLCLGVKDCCKIAGWGMDLGLADCSAEEKLLADNRGKGLCVEVGTYCAEKIPIIGTCIREKTNFCCFASKLTKAVQEQGRGQLGMNFGAAESPDCRGLTPEELGRIDFSRLNLMEAFADLKPQIKDPVALQSRLQQNLKQIQADYQLQQRGDK